jgi:tRNA uridine 5-carbamoylmethylation protein Kti12
MTVLVVCVMGMPGCGKTTLCEGLIQSEQFAQKMARTWDVPEECIRMETLSFDVLERDEKSRNGVRDDEFDPAIWRAARSRAEGIVLGYRETSDDRNVRVLLLDDNFYYKSMRKTFRPDGIIYTDIPENVSYSRNGARGPSQVPRHVMDNMSAMLEPPASSSVPVLTLKSMGDISPSATVLEVIDSTDFWSSVHEHSLSSSLPSPSCTLTIYEQSLNDYEVALRQCVAAFFQYRPEIRGRHGVAISEDKKRYMRDFKSALRLSPEATIGDLVSEFTQFLVMKYS